jgi:hypothetical protein
LLWSKCEIVVTAEHKILAVDLGAGVIVVGEVEPAAQFVVSAELARQAHEALGADGRAVAVIKDGRRIVAVKVGEERVDAGFRGSRNPHRAGHGGVRVGDMDIEWLIALGRYGLVGGSSAYRSILISGSGASPPACSDPRPTPRRSR